MKYLLVFPIAMAASALILTIWFIKEMRAYDKQERLEAQQEEIDFSLWQMELKHGHV